MTRIVNNNITPLSLLWACDDKELQEVLGIIETKGVSTRIIIDVEPITSEYMAEINWVCLETGIPINHCDD